MFFRSEDAVDRWCAASHRSRGEVLALEQLWTLAQVWYANRLSPDYHGRTAADVEAIFQRLGLTTPFWQIGPDPLAPQK